MLRTFKSRVVRRTFWLIKVVRRTFWLIKVVRRTFWLIKVVRKTFWLIKVVRRTFWLTKVVPTWKTFEKRWVRRNADTKSWQHSNCGHQMVRDNVTGRNILFYRHSPWDANRTVTAYCFTNGKSSARGMEQRRAFMPANMTVQNINKTTYTNNIRANLHFCTLDVHRRWFIFSECERWKLKCLYLSMVQFVSLVFQMSATKMLNVEIELISLALAEECRKILETRKKRRPRRWWVKPWIGRREQLGASTQLSQNNSKHVSICSSFHAQDIFKLCLHN
jgi:hypothetical protein